MNSVAKQYVPGNDVNHVLTNMRNQITFINRANHLGSIELKFKNEEAAKGYVLHNIKMEKWWFFLLYLLEKLERIRVDTFPPNIKIERVFYRHNKSH